MNENLKLKGLVNVKHYDKNKNLIGEKDFQNLIVNVGKSQVVKLIGGLSGSNPFSYIAIGTGTTAEAVTDTALESETNRVQATLSQVTTNVNNDTLQLVSSFSFSADASITEYGILDASSNGNLLSHKTDSAVNVHNGDTLQVTWQIIVN